MHKYAYTKQFSKPNYQFDYPLMYNQGYRDAQEGKPSDYNPWKRGTLAQAEAWRAGYDDGIKYGTRQFSDDLSEVEPKTKLPEGTFTKSAKEIVDTLNKYARDHNHAVKMINFYINRAGDNLSNKDEVMKAKDIIESQE